MNDVAAAPLGAKTPWHLWAVGALGLFWNAYGAYDYFMSKTRGEAYLREVGMTDVQVAHYQAMPAWMTAIWAVGVWGAVLGSALLLLRNRFAVPAFAASLAGFLVSLVYAYVLAPIPGGLGAPMLIMQGVILAACVFFLWYANAQAKAGHLR